MSWTIEDSGSQTCTVTATEYTLKDAEVGGAGTFALIVDTDDLGAGERVLLRAYGQVRTTDAEVLAAPVVLLSGAMAQKRFEVFALMLQDGADYKFTVEQIDGGSGAVLPWMIVTR